jgi:hypothetical protein
MASSEIKALHTRVGVYLSNVSEIIIDDSKPAVITRVPIESTFSQFVSVDDLPNTEDLPFIPERMRDFAYRYATEFKTQQAWSKTYGVNKGTVERWLRHPGVKSYVALARLEKRFYTMARRSALENKVWARLNEFMNIKITGDNAGAVARILEFSYKILNTPEELGSREKGVFNQSIYVNTPESAEGQAAFAQPRDVTPNPRQLDELQKRLDRVRMMDDRKSDMDAEVVD